MKPLPKLHSGGEFRKRYLYVAVDRASRSADLAVYDEEIAANAVAFLEAAVTAFPFTVTQVLTDGGSGFTADAFENAGKRLGVSHRTTRPYTPQTNGRVERFNGRGHSEGLGITIHNHADLEPLLAGFNQAHNARRQRVLKGQSPNTVIAERLTANPELANPCYKPPPNDALDKAMLVAERAKEVSQPDS